MVGHCKVKTHSPYPLSCFCSHSCIAYMFQILLITLALESLHNTASFSLQPSISSYFLLNQFLAYFTVPWGSLPFFIIWVSTFLCFWFWFLHSWLDPVICFRLRTTNTNPNRKWQEVTVNYWSTWYSPGNNWCFITT